MSKIGSFSNVVFGPILGVFFGQKHPIELPPRTPLGLKNVAVTHKRKRDDAAAAAASAEAASDINKSWRQVLGNPPPRSRVKEWIAFQKKKWEHQARQKHWVNFGLGSL